MSSIYSEETSRDIQARETRKKIYDAAWHLIEEQGFEKVSVDKICSRAGVAKGSFYHHFKSKGDLIIEGYSLCDKYFENEVEGKLLSANTAGKIVEFVGHQMKYAEDMGIDLMREVYKAQLEFGTRFFISAERSLPRILKQIIIEGHSCGELKKDMDADYITAFILRFSRGLIYDWCLREGAFNLKQVAMEACARILPIFGL